MADDRLTYRQWRCTANTLTPSSCSVRRDEPTRREPPSPSAAISLHIPQHTTAPAAPATPFPANLASGSSPRQSSLSSRFNPGDKGLAVQTHRASGPRERVARVARGVRVAEVIMQIRKSRAATMNGSPCMSHKPWRPPPLFCPEHKHYRRSHGAPLLKWTRVVRAAAFAKRRGTFECNVVATIETNHNPRRTIFVNAYVQGLLMPILLLMCDLPAKEQVRITTSRYRTILCRGTMGTTAASHMRNSAEKGRL